MESNDNSTIKVGVFIFLGLVLMAISILMIGGDRMLFTQYYHLRAQFSQVQGLQHGSVISLAGLPVGNVNRIDLLPGNNTVEVIMDIDEEFAPRITQGAVASVRTQGALGDKFIYITPGPIGSPQLKDGATLQTDDKADLLDILSERGSELTNVIDVVQEVHKLLVNINKDERSALLMENLVSSSQNLDKTLSESHLLIKELRAANSGQELKTSLASLSSILRKVDEGKGSLGSMVNSPDLHDQIMGLLGEKPRNKYLKPLIRATIQSHDQVD